MKIFINIIKAIAWAFIGFFGLFVPLYLMAAMLLPKINVYSPSHDQRRVFIYILTNGDHTDIVVPVKNETKDWSREIKFNNTISKDTSFSLLALGWGDKGFYLNTPSWAQLKFSVAFKAATGLSTSAMHATFYHELKENNDCIKIALSKKEYQQLVYYIDKSFQVDSSGHYIYISTNAQYGKNDAFYDARRRYNMFYTCNTWANNALKSCGQKACLWTPFDKGIFDLYRYNK